MRERTESNSLSLDEGRALLLDTHVNAPARLADSDPADNVWMPPSAEQVIARTKEANAGLQKEVLQLEKENAELASKKPAGYEGQVRQNTQLIQRKKDQIVGNCTRKNNLADHSLTEKQERAMIVALVRRRRDRLPSGAKMMNNADIRSGAILSRVAKPGLEAWAKDVVSPAPADSATEEQLMAGLCAAMGLNGAAESEITTNVVTRVLTAAR